MITDDYKWWDVPTCDSKSTDINKVKKTRKCLRAVQKWTSRNYLHTLKLHPASIDCYCWSYGKTITIQNKKNKRKRGKLVILIMTQSKHCFNLGWLCKVHIAQTLINYDFIQVHFNLLLHVRCHPPVKLRSLVSEHSHRSHKLKDIKLTFTVLLILSINLKEVM